jgi:hypothetical protein
MLASGGVGGGRLWAAMPAGRTAVVAAATVAMAAGRGGGRLGPASRISGSVVMTGQFGVSSALHGTATIRPTAPIAPSDVRRISQALVMV